jgi:hypothetical protein
MEVTYPIYVLERDDFSFREFKSPEQLAFCERVDVLDRLYDGWDSMGRHFTIDWDDCRDEPTVRAAEETSLNAFSGAVERYAELYPGDQTLSGSYRGSNYYDLCDPGYLRSQLKTMQLQSSDRNEGRGEK